MEVKRFEQGRLARVVLPGDQVHALQLVDVKTGKATKVLDADVFKHGSSTA
jgi:hypothetical protein